MHWLHPSSHLTASLIVSDYAVVLGRGLAVGPIQQVEVNLILY